MRIAATILILTAAAALASPWQMLLARKKANAGGGDETIVFTESFDAAGDGFENTWGSTDPSNALQVTSAQYVDGSQSLFVDGTDVAGVNHWIVHDLGAGSGLTNFTIRVYVRHPGTDENDVRLLTLDSDGVNPDAFDLGTLFWTDSGVIRWYRGDGGGVQTASISTGAWVLAEVHMPSGDWRIDGINQTGAGSNTTGGQLRYIVIGEDLDAGDNGAAYLDAIAVRDATGLTGDDRWIGAVP